MEFPTDRSESHTTTNATPTPVPSTLKEWMTRKDRLRSEMHTAGGDQFPEGQLMEVQSVHRGKLELWALPLTRMDSGGMRGIRKVRPDDVELLPEDSPAAHAA